MDIRNLTLPLGRRCVVTKKMAKADFAWLKRDIEVGEEWFEVSDIFGCATRDGSGFTASQSSTGVPYTELKYTHVTFDNK